MQRVAASSEQIEKLEKRKLQDGDIGKKKTCFAFSLSSPQLLYYYFPYSRQKKELGKKGFGNILILT